jgi:hypothetical protein
MAKILLGCLISSSMPKRAVIVVCAILDFIYLAQYTLHDDDTLGYMETALKTWHRNKSCFVNLGAHDDLNIPKFHSLQHYIECIRFFGTTDNYNMEMFERLHIDVAKKGWRATNKRDEFPQMTHWLSRQENIHSFSLELSTIMDQQSQPITSVSASTPASSSKRPILLPKVPTSPNKSLWAIETGHCVPCFSAHLKAYLEMLKFDATQNSVTDAMTRDLPFQCLNVYHSFKFLPEQLEEGVEVKDVVKASPLNGGRFDTVVVITGDSAKGVGLTGKLSIRFALFLHLMLTY